MQRILLLGGFGFIATNILKYIDRYCANDYEVVVFDRIAEHPHGIRCGCVKRVYAGDFADESCLDNVFRNERIDFVLHCLSSTVPATSGNAKYDVQSNLVATLGLLAVMDRYNVKDIVYLSSGGAIYGDYLQKVHHEEDAVYPKSSYGVVKLAIEKYMLSYAELYGFRTLIIRLSNPFGRYHYNERQGVINVALRKALKEEPLEIWGSGDGVKDYIFIDDFCEILFRLIRCGIETEVYNVAGGVSLSVNQIVRRIKRLLPSFEWKYVNQSMNDVQNFELDITKLRNKLGILEMTEFGDALQQTCLWQQSVGVQKTNELFS